MNINRINSIYQAYGATNVKKINKTEATSSAKDVINISNEAKDFQNAFKAAMNASDVREELVADIKEKMDKGDYEVNTDDLVDKILKRKK